MKVCEFDSWREFRAFVDDDKELSSSYWRGQNDMDSPLASSFERTILLMNGGHAPDAAMIYPYDGRYTRDEDGVLKDGFIRESRNRYLTAFQKAASGLRGHHPAHLTTEQWWALGRHYGLVSPYLDWSEKPYIAAFFVLAALFQEMSTPRGIRYSGKRGALYKLRDDGRLEGDGLRIVQVTVDELGRLYNQRAIFTWLDSEQYFELQGFLDDTGRGELLTKIVLHDKCVMDGLKDLSAHGLDYRMIYPDLTGAALYANTRWNMLERVSRE